MTGSQGTDGSRKLKEDKGLGNDFTITNPSDSLKQTEGGGENVTRATLIRTLSQSKPRFTSHTA